MKVLVVGNGGREHALSWKIGESPLVDAVYSTRPNAGQALVAQDLGVAASDNVGILAALQSEGIELVVIGPEAPLVSGLSDLLREQGILVVGPSAAAARLEGSKAFAKEMMDRIGVPTAEFATFTTLDEAKEYVRGVAHPRVVKASGLAAGKGVVICETLEESLLALEEMLAGGRFGDAGSEVVIEEFLIGEEASLIALCCGLEAIPLASSQDHKRLGDGDEGPNTGGMGAYSPAPVLPDLELHSAMKLAIQPVLEAMVADGMPFQGFLYAGLMITESGAKVLEYNVRLGDPETQAILPRLQDDLVPALLAAARGESLQDISFAWDPRPCVCVVAASHGYPVSTRTGDAILGLEDVSEDTLVFHAGTRKEGDTVVTSGGRVLSVVALGDTYGKAVERAYTGLDSISFDGMQHRRDIAARAFNR